MHITNDNDESTNSKKEKRQSKQSPRLPYKMWFILAKLLGIRLHPGDKPVIGAMMHVFTLLFALGYAITFCWYKIYDIRSEYTKETVLTGSVAILMVIYWCALGVYSHRLAARLFLNSKFVDSVRLHTKTIFKISAAGLMVVLGIAVVILTSIQSASNYHPKWCIKVSLNVLVCRFMYAMHVGCLCVALLWNLLVGIVLLSVCRTHTIGIRRFIHELENDGRYYEIQHRLRMQTRMRERDMLGQPRDQHDELWDDIEVDMLLYPKSQPLKRRSQSVPSSSDQHPTNQANAGAHSLPRDTSALDAQPSFDEDRLKNGTSDEAKQGMFVKEHHYSEYDDVEHTSDDVPILSDIGGAANNNASSFKGHETIADAADVERMLPMQSSCIQDRYGNATALDSGPAPDEGTSERDEVQGLNGGCALEMSTLTVDEIYLRFWKISCRLRFTSIALQRWVIALIIFIFLWCFTFIFQWVKHDATLMDIAQFLIPIFILPIVCSAYGEVNYEGKRMVRSICPTTERTEMLQTLYQQPLELTAFGFAISYQVMVGALGALAIAFCTRLVMDEISS